MAIATRYAKGLIALAAEERQLDKLFANMIVVQEIAAGVPHFVESLADERVKFSTRVEAAKRVIKALELTEMVGNAILLLMHKGRIGLLPLVAKAILKNIRARKKLTVANAWVADRAEADALAVRVEDILSEVLGMTVECEVDIDPTLIGGFVVEVGDARFDASIKGKLTNMKEEFFSEAKGV